MKAPSPPWILRQRNRLWTVASYAIGLAAFTAIALLGGKDSLSDVLSPQALPLTLYFAVNLLLLSVSTLRWRLAVRCVSGVDQLDGADAFFCVVFGRFVGQFLTRIGGDFLVRPGVMNRLTGLPLRQLMLSTVADRIFDVALMLLLLGPAALHLLGVLTGQVAVIAAALLVVAASGLVLRFRGQLTAVARRASNLGYALVGRLPLLRRLPRPEGPDLSATQRTRITQLRPLAQLVGLTLVRLLVLLLRLIVLSWMFGLQISPTTLFFGIPVAQLGLVLGITPGGLGVLEGGWYAVFAAVGIPSGDAATFLVGQRAYLYVFISLALILSYIVFGLRRGWRSRET